MSDEKKKGILRFEEEMKQFTCYEKGKGISHPRILSVDMYLDHEHIGYITGDGNVTMSGHITEDDPTRFMSYSLTFTSEQWDEIGSKKNEFVKKCVARELEFGPAFKKVEELARKMFPEDEPFRHVEIGRCGRNRVVIGGGIGLYSTHKPGFYANWDCGEGVESTIGYRSVDEQRIKGVNNLEDELLLEMVKFANSIPVEENEDQPQTEALPGKERTDEYEHYQGS